MNDKLDLLGVRHDCEMELKMKYELAKEVSDYWKENCTDDDFYKNCIETLNIRLGHHESVVIHDDVYEVWEIIENEFI